MPVKLPSVTIRRKCLNKVLAVAKRYDLPPAHITAHVRTVPAIKARREVYRYMMEKLGLSRAVVAYAFNRDLRRVRQSVIGGPPRKKRKRIVPRLDYSRFDLLGNPLDAVPSRRHRVQAPVMEACQLLALLLPDHPQAIAYRTRHGLGTLPGQPARSRTGCL